MAANKQQGSYFGLFLVGATVVCAGFAYFDSGFGKALLALGAIVFIGSLFGFMGSRAAQPRDPTKHSQSQPRCRRRLLRRAPVLGVVGGRRDRGHG